MSGNNRGRSRREFLAAGAALAGGSLLHGQTPAERYTSRGGLLEAPIEANLWRLDLAGRSALASTFNRQIPSPLLETRAGDTVRLRFVNNLPDPSNIHYHGLHVSPSGNGDNVFLEIDAGETLTYEFTLPVNHQAGTYWYHPHLHGYTFRQLGGGMAGIFLIRGALDEIPEIAAARENILVLKDYAVQRDGSVTAGPILTCSGRVTPRLAIEQGGALRLRLLNASVDLYFRLRLEEHPLYVIAVDGGGLQEPREVDTLLMAPAQRVEVLVLGTRPPGVYRLLNLHYDSHGTGMVTTDAPPAVVASIAYEGRAERTLGLPQRLVRVEPLPPSTLPRRTFTLRSRALPTGFEFQINGLTFDHQRVDTRVRLNTVEDWEFINTDTMDHPIHLHTNFFQILGPNGEPEAAWRDIMNVPGGESRRFRVGFTDFVGRTVYHCHRVAHGDLGMMGVLEIEESLPPRTRIP